MPGAEMDLKRELFEAGNRLLRLPGSVDELSALLDRVEHCLALVEQQPPVAMQDALCPSFKALVTDELLRHPDEDVKVGVTSCLTELSRITAPDVPYNDELMKEVFKLTVSAFKGLADNSSKSYGKRVAILDTVAKVRSCAVLLDLDCDALVVEMFQNFYKCIRGFHTGNVVSSMEGIMTLVIEELEEIPTDLLCTLLSVFEKENKDVLPVARILGEKVVQKCATKLKSFVLEAIKSLRISLVDYNQVVASLCQITSEYDFPSEDLPSDPLVQGKESEPTVKTVEKEAQEMEIVVDAPVSLKSVDGSMTNFVPNGINVWVEGHAAQELNLLNKPDSAVVERASENNHEKVQPVFDNLRVDTAMKPASVSLPSSEPNSERIPKKRGRKPKANMDAEKIELKQLPPPDGNKESSTLPAPKVNLDTPNALPDNSSAEAILSQRNQDSHSQLLSPTLVETNVLASVSPSQSESSAGLSIRKKVGRPRKVKSTDGKTSNQKTLNKVSDGFSNQETKHLVSMDKKTPDAKKDASKIHLLVKVKKEEGEASDLEDKSLKRSGAQLDADNETPSCKKRGRPRKDASVSGATVTKDGIPLEGTSTKRTKRKFTPGNGKAYREELVGARIKVWWPADKAYYTGIIQSYNPLTKRHRILYNDGEAEKLNLFREKWKFVEGGMGSEKEGTTGYNNTGDASEMHQAKKLKTDPGSAGTQGNTDTPLKKRRGRPPKNPLTATNSDIGAKCRKPEEEAKTSDSKIATVTETGNPVKSVESIGNGLDAPNISVGCKKSNHDMPEETVPQSKKDSGLDTGVMDTVAVRLDLNETVLSTSDATPKTIDTVLPKSVKSDVNEIGEQKAGPSVKLETEGMNSSSVSEVKPKRKRRRKSFSSSSPATEVNTDPPIKRRPGRPPKQSVGYSDSRPKDPSKPVGDHKVDESRRLGTSDTAKIIKAEGSWGVGRHVPVSAEHKSSLHGALNDNIGQPDPQATATSNETELPKSNNIPGEFKPGSSTGLKLKFRTSGSETNSPKEKLKTNTTSSNDQLNKDGSIKRPRGRPCKPKVENSKPDGKTETNKPTNEGQPTVDIAARAVVSFGEGSCVVEKDNYLYLFNKPLNSDEADVGTKSKEDAAKMTVGASLESGNKSDANGTVDLKLSLATGTNAGDMRESLPESGKDVEMMSQKPEISGDLGKSGSHKSL